MGEEEASALTEGGGTKHGGLEKKAAFDAHSELSKIHFQHFDTRRSFEWKITLAIWATILLLTKGMIDLREWTHASAVAAYLPWGYGFAFLIYAGHWIPRMYAANKYDKDRANFHLDRARDLVPHRLVDTPRQAEYRHGHRDQTPAEVEATDPSRFQFLTVWNHTTQILITLLLMLGSWWAITCTV